MTDKHSVYHVPNPDGTEDEDGQELEGAVESNKPDKDFVQKPFRDKPHNDQSPDGEEG